MDWNRIVERVAPYVVKIETPAGHGTGFLCLYNENRTFCGIATACHVVEHAERWQEPIRLTHFSSKTNSFLREGDRVIFSEPFKDSAVILIPTGKLDLPDNPIQLLPTVNRLPFGVEIGWLGYPGLVQNTLCFFSGNVSAWDDARSAYLIDGVAINGVSGGPVVYSTETEGVQIVGAISAYRANRATGEALPGLAIAQDVSHFHDIASQIRTFDEANHQKQALSQQPPTADPAPPEGEPSET